MKNNAKMKGVEILSKIGGERLQPKMYYYDEVFALNAHLKTIHLLISLAAQNKWGIYQMDVKSFYFILTFYLEE